MYDISLASLTINIEDKIYKDKVDIQPDDFFGIMKALADFPTTGMPSSAEHLKIIQKAVEAGYKEVGSICMSSGTSGAYQSAVLAEDYYFEGSPEANVT